MFFLLLHERHLSGYDPANFVLALKYGFSIAQERPHVPGYPGFYLLWKAIEFVTSLPPHDVILAANLLFTLTAIWLTYWVARRLFNERTARIASVLVLTNPLLLYYGNTAELYAYDAAFSAFLVVLLLAPPKRYNSLRYFVFGLLGAFRLSSVILTLPVVLAVLTYRYYRTRNRRGLVGNLIALCLGILAWLIPYTIHLGGITAFIQVVQGAAYLPITVPQNLFTFCVFMFWMVNVLGIVLLLHAKQLWKKLREWDEPYIVLILLIVTPATFFALKYYAKGYGLLYLAPVALLASHLLARSRRRTQWVWSAVIVNMLIFFTVPFIVPALRSTLSYSHRTMGERWETAFLRGISAFAPTLAHLRVNEQGMESVVPLLQPLRQGSYVLVDASASGWAYPRSLQVAYPGLVFLMRYTNDSSVFRWYSAGLTGYNLSLSHIPGSVAFYHLTTSANVREIGSPPGSRVSMSAPFELYAIDRSNFPFLQHQLDSLFIKG